MKNCRLSMKKYILIFTAFTLIGSVYYLFCFRSDRTIYGFGNKSLEINRKIFLIPDFIYYELKDRIFVSKVLHFYASPGVLSDYQSFTLDKGLAERKINFGFECDIVNFSKLEFLVNKERFDEHFLLEDSYYLRKLRSNNGPFDVIGVYPPLVNTKGDYILSLVRYSEIIAIIDIVVPYEGASEIKDWKDIKAEGLILTPNHHFTIEISAEDFFSDDLIQRYRFF